MVWSGNGKFEMCSRGLTTNYGLPVRFMAFLPSPRPGWMKGALGYGQGGFSTLLDYTVEIGDCKFLLHGNINW